MCVHMFTFCTGSQKKFVVQLYNDSKDIILLYCIILLYVILYYIILYYIIITLYYNSYGYYYFVEPLYISCMFPKSGNKWKQKFT